MYIYQRPGSSGSVARCHYSQVIAVFTHEREQPLKKYRQRSLPTAMAVDFLSVRGNTVVVAVAAVVVAVKHIIMISSQGQLHQRVICCIFSIKIN